MSEAHQREAAIFDVVMELPPEQRAAYLDQACGGDPALRQRVEALLKACDSRCEFLDSPTDPARRQTFEITVPPSEKPGDRIGRYKLLQRIGEGGCGVVYMAEQEEPVSRRVALKIIKLGMDTKLVIARFEAERQALAMMDHPSIAKVFDAGATETGRPYFVMELVRGLKITDFCDEKELPTHQRLDLFIQVCQAIQHAHQKGIIHRDLKPSNILVSVNDGVAVPKIIDFGIAKAASGQKLTDKTLFTAFEQFIGTPAYMSPEQAVITNVDIDTRSDIYALGVLLYELLTGKTPFDPKELLSIGLDEMRRTIRETEPPRPSTRVSTLPGQELSTTAHRRGLEAPKLVSELRGDLDWIAMKCLEKDRARRYETANGLAMDIQRHLDNEPVGACPPSRLYRFQKTVRRNKLAFAAGSAVLASLVLGLTLSTVFFFRERAARESANESAAIAQAVNEFLRRDLLQQASSHSQAEAGFTPDPDLTVREALERAAKRIGDRFHDQPLVEAGVRMSLGETLIEVGEAERAIPHLQRALALRQANLGTNHLGALSSMGVLGWAYREASQLEQALPLLKETVELRTAKLGPDHPATLNAMNNLASAYQAAGQLEQALPLRKKTLKLRQDSRGPDDPATLAAMANLATAYRAIGQREQAQRLVEKALSRMQARLPPGHPATLGAMNNLATVYQDADQLDRALPLYEQTLKLREASQGPDHPDTLIARNNLAWACETAGRIDQARLLFEETLRLTEAKLGPGHPKTWRARINLAEVLGRQGKWKEAADGFASLIQSDPTDHYYYHSLAPLLVARGDLEDYRRCCKELVARFSDTTKQLVGYLAAKNCSILPSSGADPETVGKLADVAAAAGTTNDFFAWFQCTKGLAEYRQGHFADALTFADKTIAIREDPGDYSWHDTLYLEAYAVSAMAHFRLKQTDAARAALAEANTIAARLPKSGSEDLGPEWRDWIIAHKLLDEATALIEGSPETRTQTQ